MISCSSRAWCCHKISFLSLSKLIVSSTTIHDLLSGENISICCHLCLAFKRTVPDLNVDGDWRGRPLERRRQRICWSSRTSLYSWNELEQRFTHRTKKGRSQSNDHDLVSSLSPAFDMKFIRIRWSVLPWYATCDEHRRQHRKYHSLIMSGNRDEESEASRDFGLTRTWDDLEEIDGNIAVISISEAEKRKR